MVVMLRESGWIVQCEPSECKCKMTTILQTGLSVELNSIESNTAYGACLKIANGGGKHKRLLTNVKQHHYLCKVMLADRIQRAIELVPAVNLIGAIDCAKIGIKYYEIRGPAMID